MCVLCLCQGFVFGVNSSNKVRIKNHAHNVKPHKKNRTMKISKTLVKLGLVIIIGIVLFVTGQLSTDPDPYVNTEDYVFSMDSVIAKKGRYFVVKKDGKKAVYAMDKNHQLIPMAENADSISFIANDESRSEENYIYVEENGKLTFFVYKNGLRYLPWTEADELIAVTNNGVEYVAAVRKGNKLVIVTKNGAREVGGLYNQRWMKRNKIHHVAVN